MSRGVHKMNASLRKNVKYPFIRRILAKKYDKAALRRILDGAETHYAALSARCEGATSGEWFHLNNTILPTAAVYKALLDTDADHALAVTHEAVLSLCRMGNRMMRFILRIPGMKGLFMRLLPKMALGMFGRDCGFDYTHYAADSTRLEMDVTICPYCKHAVLLGVEALLPTFCESDFATYDDLPGIRFRRTQTLGSGGSCCDFRFVRE